MGEDAAAGTQPSLALIPLPPSDAGNDEILLGESGYLLLHHVGGLGLDYMLASLCSALKKECGDKSESTHFMRKCKAHICIGVNNVTRTLERMPHTSINSFAKEVGDKEVQRQKRSARSSKGTRPITLQAVLVAADVHPRLLASHLPRLATTRKVPCISISGGNGTGSMRLAEILNLRTAIAIGVKVGDSEINKVIEHCLNEKWG